MTDHEKRIREAVASCESFSDNDLRALLADLDAMRGELLKIARMAEDLKKPCSMDADSPQAIRNGQYMNICYAAHAALKGASHE
jgi:hypothetical protein